MQGLKGFSGFGGLRFFFFSSCPFSCESQGQIEICWLQCLEDGSKDPGPGSEFPDPAGNQRIRTYVQKSIRYLEKVRRRCNFAFLLNWITTIMFGDNILMLTITTAPFFFFPHTAETAYSCHAAVAYLCLPSALGGFSHVHIRSFWVLLSLNSCGLILDRAEFFLCSHTQAGLWTKDF